MESVSVLFCKQSSHRHQQQSREEEAKSLRDQSSKTENENRRIYDGPRIGGRHGRAGRFKIHENNIMVPASFKNMFTALACACNDRTCERVCVCVRGIPKILDTQRYIF